MPDWLRLPDLAASDPEIVRAPDGAVLEAGAPPLKVGGRLLGLPWESTNHFDGWELHRVSKEYLKLAEQP